MKNKKFADLELPNQYILLLYFMGLNILGLEMEEKQQIEPKETVGRALSKADEVINAMSEQQFKDMVAQVEEIVKKTFKKKRKSKNVT